MGLADLLQALRSIGAEVGAGDVLDALWLARHLDGGLFEASSDLSEPPAPEPMPHVSAERRGRRAGKSRTFAQTPTPKMPRDPIWPDANIPKGERGASFGSIPAARVLSDRLALSRALRPFTLRKRSTETFEMDEDATVEATATLRFPFPVLRPEPQRWFTLDLVLEDDPAILLWRETLRELFSLLQTIGAFRDVRFWYLQRCRGPGDPTSEADFVLVSPDGARLATKFVAGSGTQRLVLFATHGASANWTDGSYARLLESWIDTSSVALLYLLPDTDLKRSALGEVQGICTTITPGAPTAKLDVRRFWWSASEDAGSSFVPIMGLDPPGLNRFAKMQMGMGGNNPAIFLDRTRWEAPAAEELTVDDFDQVISALSVRSPQAFRLATLLCMSPFTLPVARLIQEITFGRDPPQHVLAQVLLSGLVGLAGGGEDFDPEKTYFQFRSSARDILMRSLSKADAEAAATELEARISHHIEEFWDRSRRYLVRYADEGGESSLPDFAPAFASVSRALLGDPASLEDLRANVAEFRNRLGEQRIAEVMEALRRSEDLPLDPDEIGQDAWEGLVDGRLVRRSAHGEWRLRVGVLDELLAWAHSLDRPRSGTTAPSNVVQFAIVVHSTFSRSGGPLAQARESAARFADWARLAGAVCDEFENPTFKDIWQASEALTASANSSIDRRRLYFYFCGYTELTDELLLRIPDRDQPLTPFLRYLAHYLNNGVFDEIIFIVDPLGGPMPQEPMLKPVLGYPPGAGPSALLLGSRAPMSLRRLPRSFTTDVIDGLESPARDGLVTTHSLVRFLRERLDETLVAEAVGHDFTITGPLPAKMPTEGLIERVLIVGASRSDLRSLRLLNVKSEISGDETLYNQVTMTANGGAMEIAMLTPKAWAEQRASEAIAMFRPQAVFELGITYREERARECDVLVASELLTLPGMSVVPSPRMIEVARRVSLDSEWMRYLPHKPARRIRVRLGRLADPQMERVLDRSNFEGFVGELNRFVGLQLDSPTIHFLSVRAVSEPQSSRPGRLEETIRLATAFLFGLVEAIIPPAERSASVSREASALAQAKSRIDMLNSDRFEDTATDLEAQVRAIVSLLGRTPASREHRLEWAQLQQRLGTIYFDLGERQNRTELFSDAIARFDAAIQIFRRYDPVEGARTSVSRGSTLQKRGEMSDDRGDLDEALLTYRNAAKTLRSRKRVHEADNAEALAAAVLERLEQLSVPRSRTSTRSKRKPVAKSKPSQVSKRAGRQKSKSSAKKPAKQRSTKRSSRKIAAKKKRKKK